MKKSLIVAAMLAVGLGALGASSFFPEFYHVFNPAEGYWSRYRITDSRGEVATLTFSVVGKEQDNIWLEVTTVQEGHEGVAGYLLKGDPTDDANVLMIRAQNAGEPALEIDKATLQKLKTEGREAFGGDRAQAIGPTVGKLQGLPDEALTVGTRKLTCKHLKILGTDEKEAEVWIHDDVAPFGIVRLLSGKEEVLLIDYGAGAKPKLKGPFTKLDVQ